LGGDSAEAARKFGAHFDRYLESDQVEQKPERDQSTRHHAKANEHFFCGDRNFAYGARRA